ncbi:unnamed protein product, partial [Prorocentrum cordatum]
VARYVGSCLATLRIGLRDVTGGPQGKAAAKGTGKSGGIVAGRRFATIIPEGVRPNMICSHGVEMYGGRSAPDLPGVSAGGEFAEGRGVSLGGPGNALMLEVGATRISNSLVSRYGEAMGVMGDVVRKLSAKVELSEEEILAFKRFNARVASRARDGGEDDPDGPSKSKAGSAGTGDANPLAAYDAEIDCIDIADMESLDDEGKFDFGAADDEQEERPGRPGANAPGAANAAEAAAAEQADEGEAEDAHAGGAGPRAAIDSEESGEPTAEAGEAEREAERAKTGDGHGDEPDGATKRRRKAAFSDAVNETYKNYLRGGRKAPILDSIEVALAAARDVIARGSARLGPLCKWRNRAIRFGCALMRQAFAAGDAGARARAGQGAARACAVASLVSTFTRQVVQEMRLLETSSQSVPSNAE